MGLLGKLLYRFDLLWTIMGLLGKILYRPDLLRNMIGLLGKYYLDWTVR